MPHPITVAACGDNIPRPIPSSITTGDKMFGGALVPLRLSQGETVLRGIFVGVCGPHGIFAIIAKALLTLIRPLSEDDDS